MVIFFTGCVTGHTVLKSDKIKSETKLCSFLGRDYKKNYTTKFAIPEKEVAFQKIILF